jgi:branched-chain amino acid transport system ATP-binding protein
MTGEGGAVDREVPCLTVEGVDLWFGGTHALDELDIEVRSGEVFGIIGPNGAGKSSLLNVINGYYRPDKGRVLLRDADVTGMRPHEIARLGIGRTFQNIELSPESTVLQNIMLGRHIHFRTGTLRELLRLGPARSDEARQRRRVEEILAFLDLGPLRHHPVSDMPYGQQKLVELARALAMEPNVLLLDEPTAGMTAEERADVATQIVRLQRETGLTQVLIEHDAGFIRELCDRVVVLDFGKTIALGTPAEVMADPAVMEAYLGTSADVRAELEAARRG